MKIKYKKGIWTRLLSVLFFPIILIFNMLYIVPKLELCIGECDSLAYILLSSILFSLFELIIGLFIIITVLGLIIYIIKGNHEKI